MRPLGCRDPSVQKIDEAICRSLEMAIPPPDAGIDRVEAGSVSARYRARRIQFGEILKRLPGSQAPACRLELKHGLFAQAEEERLPDPSPITQRKIF